MLYNKKTYIVQTSKNIFFKFYIKNEKLTLEKSSNNNINGKVLLEENILNFSLDIDRNDKIHIIYVSKNNVLKYTIFPSQNNSMNIISLKDNFFVDKLDIKSIRNDIHIFYKTNNLCNGKNILWHYYFKENTYNKKKIFEIPYTKYVNPYFIDNYKNDIYLLFCNNYNTNKYSIEKYNIDSDMWYNLENNIMLKDINNLNFFITPHNIGILSYNKSIKNTSQILLKYKDFNTKNSHWSKEIFISNNSINSFKPIIFYKNKYTYVMWYEGNNILYKRSRDLINWSDESILDIYNKKNPTYIYIYLNNNDTSSKFNIIFSSYLKNLNIFPNVVAPLKDLTLDSLKVTSIKPYNNKNNLNIEKYTELQKVFDKIIRDKNNTIEKISSMNSYLLLQINSLKNELTNYEKKLSKLKNEKNNLSKKSNKSIDYYKDKLSVLELKFQIYSFNKDKKVNSLLKIIQNKDLTIQNLHDLINKKNSI